jgi:hypothetical protein
MTNPYGRILGFLDRLDWILLYQNRHKKSYSVMVEQPVTSVRQFLTGRKEFTIFLGRHQLQKYFSNVLEINCPTFWTFVSQRVFPKNSAAAMSCFDLSSDHSPVIVVLSTHALPPETPPILNNR